MFPGPFPPCFACKAAVRPVCVVRHTPSRAVPPHFPLCSPSRRINRPAFVPGQARSFDAMRKSPCAVLAVLALGIVALPAAFAQSPGQPLEIAPRREQGGGGRGAREPRRSDERQARGRDRVHGHLPQCRQATPSRGCRRPSPIPSQTEFIPGTARPARAMASLDALAFADLPLKRTVTRDGKPVEVTRALPGIPGPSLVGRRARRREDGFVHRTRPGAGRPRVERAGRPRGWPVRRDRTIS